MEENLPYERCIHCGELQHIGTTFCGTCGRPFAALKIEETKKSVTHVLIFYVGFLLISILFEWIRGTDDSLGTEIVIETIFALVTLGFCFLDWKNVLTKYNVSRVDSNAVILVVLVSVIGAFTVYYAMEWVNQALFGYTDNIFLGYAVYNNSIFWSVLFVAITPPIFEELAFRGFLFGQLQDITSSKVTIIATAFIFALVHFSFLSFLWIFPFGIFLGFLRNKYNTLWLGMLAHFLHNFIVLVLDYLHYTG